MASSPQHEPTMEEILASIRKIISEDSTEAQAAPVAEAPPAPVSAAAAEADVLELTQEVQDEPVTPAPEPVADNDIEFKTVDEPVQAAPEPMPEPEPEPILEPEPLPEPEPEPVAEVVPEPELVAEPEPEAIVEPEPEPEAPAPVAAAGAEDIFSDKTRKALDDAFANIDESIPEETPEAAEAVSLPSGGEQAIGAVILEAVREKVDPAIKEWLGNNSEAIVEHMKPYIRAWMDEHFPALLEGAVRGEVARVVKARGTKR
jgi:uncharacterized protein